MDGSAGRSLDPAPPTPSTDALGRRRIDVEPTPARITRTGRGGGGAAAQRLPAGGLGRPDDRSEWEAGDPRLRRDPLGRAVGEPRRPDVPVERGQRHLADPAADRPPVHRGALRAGSHPGDRVVACDQHPLRLRVDPERRLALHGQHRLHQPQGHGPQLAAADGRAPPRGRPRHGPRPHPGRPVDHEPGPVPERLQRRGRHPGAALSRHPLLTAHDGRSAVGAP